jgi:2-desacetyl-2-hydroxyethyl bacteriochlorophyllide A dehydrogenase
MEAAVLTGPRALRVSAVHDPVPRAGEVVVRVAAAGICGTDYRIWTGERQVRYPLIPGHEFIGDVVAVGAGVERPVVGDRVAVEPNWGCGACDLCRDGSGNLCLGRTAVGIDRDGGFAELAVLPARACWTAPSELPTDVLLFAEPLAVVARAVGRAAPRSGETAAVVGAGTLGLLALQILRAKGCRVLVVGRTERRLDLARTLGADATAAGSGQALADTARELCLGQVGFVRPGGRVVLTGLPHAASRVDFFWIVRREIDVRGSMIYRDEFGEAIALLSGGAVRVGALLTHRYPLRAIGAALEAHRDPTSIKVAVFPGEAAS